MLRELLEPVTSRALVALVIGLVIGAEREQRMRSAAHRGAGIRVFALTALFGAVAAVLRHPAIVVAGGAAVAAAGIVAYALGEREDPGLTSDIALVLTYALGVLAMESPILALTFGVLSAVLLAFRVRIHAVVREIITPAELRDALTVAAAAIVVLPLLPNRTIDPWGTLNLFTLWRLVAVLLAIHFAAHVAQRALGPRWGLPIAGLASGFVSSVAAIAAMADEAEKNPDDPRGAAAAAVASHLAALLLLGFLVGAASPNLLVALALPLGAATLACLAWAAVFAIRAPRTPGRMEPPGSAVDLKGALLFALLVTGVTVAATFVERAAGSTGVVIGAALASFVDLHAAAASVASVFSEARIGAPVAEIAILACLSTSSISKIAVAYSSGPRKYASIVTAGMLLALAAAWAAWGVVRVLR